MQRSLPESRQEAEGQQKKRRAGQGSRIYCRIRRRADLTEIFKELGVDYLIEGGQTMNPSTEDMLNAIDQVNAKTHLYFP